MTQTRTTLESTFKSSDTEEWIDIHFTRPLGLIWARFFIHFDIHPNVVTILSIILGVSAGIMFYYPDMTHTVAGIVLLAWANLYDSTDGQMARMTGKKTLLGRVLDGFAGEVWFFTIYLTICLRLTAGWGVYIWLLAFLSGVICHASQCRLADYYRNIHLFFLKGGSDSELDSSRKIREDFKSLTWRESWFHKLYLFFYGNYTRAQERQSPAFQKFYAVVRERFGKAVPPSLRGDFRRGSLPLMRYANILTFNTRAIVLYVVLIAGIPWLYFVFEITVLSAVYFYMRMRHESLCRRLTAQIDRYEPKAA